MNTLNLFHKYQGEDTLIKIERKREGGGVGFIYFYAKLEFLRDECGVLFFFFDSGLVYECVRCVQNYY